MDEEYYNWIFEVEPEHDEDDGEEDDRICFT